MFCDGMMSRQIWLGMVLVVLSVASVRIGATDKPGAFTIGRMKYRGGGDWYNDPSILPNMMQYLQQQTGVSTAREEVQVALEDEKLFSCPVLFMTGHGRITFSEKEAARLRTYLTNGGFLFADDDYGMNDHFRREMKKVFPDKALVPIPFSHDIFRCFFSFANGLPKIHEHDGGPPEAYGYFHEGRLVVFYAFNTNISDGWADPDVHKDPPAIREQALKMGTNILYYALTH
jgi:hypothetical protein